MLPRILIEHLDVGRVPPEHTAQIQGGIWVAERDWLDFRGYCRGMPTMLEFRVERDDAWIDGTLRPAVLRFIDELEALVSQLSGGHVPEIAPAAPEVDLATAPPAF